jgi:hypothetical protein
LEYFRWKINLKSCHPLFQQSFKTRNIKSFKLGLIVVDILEFKFYLTLFLNTKLLQNDSLTVFQKFDSFLLNQFLCFVFFVLLLNSFFVFDLFISSIDRVKQIQFDKFVKSIELEAFVEQSVVNLC